MVVGYARVSTSSQSLETQLLKLKEAGASKIFSEKASGSSNIREELTLLMNFVRSGDILVVTRLDRLARSVFGLTKLVEELKEKGVHLVVIEQNIDTTNATGSLMLQLLASFAEFERNIILERSKEGIERARKKGVRFGRPAKLSTDQIACLKTDFDNKVLSKREISKKYGISVPSVYRLAK